MALYKNLTSANSDDRGILSEMEDFYSRSVAENQSYWSEASLDCRFESGDQTVWNELYNAPINRRQLFGFNRIRRVINLIDGHQRQNRKSIIAVPVEGGDETTASQMTKIMMWLMQQEGGLETVSDAFHGALTSGMNMMQVWVDYRRDPINGDIKLDNCSYNSFLIDPFFKKADLSDCNQLWRRSWLNSREVAALLPDHAQEIMQLPVSGTMSDGRFQYMPESRNILAKNLLSYDEYYYRDYRKQRILVDTQTGETMEWRSNDEDGLREFLQQYPQIIVQDQQIPTVSLAIVVQGTVFYRGSNPLSVDVYPFIPVFGYFRPELSYMSARIQSVVRGLRDAQYLYNRRRLIELDMLESAVTTGIIYKENALVDPKEAFMTGQGRAIAIKQNAQMTDVQQINPPQIPPSMMQLSEVLANEIQQISGVNEELLGSSSDDMAGVLSMLRQKAGSTTLQGLFDSLDRSQKLLGKLLISVIQNNFTPGKVKRITEEDPTPEFYNKNFGKYDAAIEDGLNTTSQRQLSFAQLIQLRQMGVAIPDSVIIEHITMQDKDKLIEAVQQQQQQAAQQAQQQAQIQMQEIQARAELAESRAMADRGLAVERQTRSQSNLGLAEERRVEAVKDLEQAKLNYIKQLSELESLDLAKLEKLIALSKMLEEPVDNEVKAVENNISPTQGM